MAIRKNFSGSLLRKPGAYSSVAVNQQNGTPLGGNGTLFLYGEASTGAPGSSAGFKVFSSAEFNDFVAEFTDGPLVDCALAALSPSKTTGVNGWDQLIVYKTNASTQASLALKNGSSASIITISDVKWGLAGNYKTVTVAAGTDSAKQVILTIKDLKNNITEVLSQNPAVAQLSIVYTGAGSAATATISGTGSAAALTSTCTGASGDNLNLNLNLYSMVDLVNAINATGVYTAVLLNTTSGTVTPATDLDPITASDIKSGAVNLFRLQHEIVDVVNDTSLLVTAAITANHPSIPATLTQTYLAGGAKGASTASEMSSALSKSLSQDYNVVVPCISQSASADITAGLTDPSSTYVATTVFAAVISHLQLRGSIKNRKEAQAVVGYRNSAKATVYTEAEALNYGALQLWLQDVQVVDIEGDSTWKFPHVGAAMLAGMRCGVDVGEPLTHKYMNVLSVGHVVSSTTGLSTGDFDPNVDYDAAIDAGVTFAESANGAWRVCVDNTTYGVDESFVWNRGSVVNAVQYIARNLRTAVEAVFVGTKISAGTAVSIKSFLKAQLLALRDASIITATDDFPLGYDDKNLVVSITGNAATVQVLVIPVQGLDFVLIEFSIGNIQQTA